MSTVLAGLTIAGSALGLIFSFWPFCLVFALLASPRGRIRGVLILWFAFGLSWLMTRLLSPAQLMRFIPEPLNTTLFFVTGLGLLIWSLSAGARDGEADMVTPDTVHTPEDLAKLSAAQLQKIIVALYHRRGYEAKRAGLTGERGVDVVVHTSMGRKWVVQCKRGRGRLNERNVKGFYGSLKRHKAERGILITTGTFSDKARIWAKGRPLALLDGQELLRTWKEGRIE